MKNLLSLCVLSAALAAGAQTNAVPEMTTAESSGLEADAGADLRVRQEIMHNVVGNPGDAGAMMPRAYKKNVNHIRFRPRVWGRLDYENFTLYGRLVDEFREHIVKNGVSRKYRAYNFPDSTSASAARTSSSADTPSSASTARSSTARRTSAPAPRMPTCSS